MQPFLRVSTAPLYLGLVIRGKCGDRLPAWAPGAAEEGTFFAALAAFFFFAAFFPPAAPLPPVVFLPLFLAVRVRACIGLFAGPLFMV
ncbi:hypothetical protein CAY53_07035 [Desulfobulbus oralis]|uniref:Uncharacterized protein n=1 Tax=Desulfobulbus oralis TaxID=1986146 RepID=A0A2L1GNK0_9BACT|nr:hypothetical protein CAY53_07035 [Desulfobulbus oralis]